MNFLLDPNVAYVLLVLGFIFAILALFSPGTGVLEAGALIILALAGYSIYSLPVNPWALMVLALGVFPFLLALRRSHQWIYLVLSLAALIVGSVFLFRTPGGGPAVNPGLAAFVSLLSGGFLWFVVRKGIEAIARRPDLSPDRVIGMIGEARTEIHQEGTVYVLGEEWTAQCDERIQAGEKVRVVGRNGLVLQVEPVKPDAAGV